MNKLFIPIIILIALGFYFATLEEPNFNEQELVPVKIDNSTKQQVAKPERKAIDPKTLPKAKEVTSDTKRPKNYVPATNASQKLIDEQVKIRTEGYGKYPPVDLDNMNEHKAHVVAALKDPKNNSGAISIVGKRTPFDLEKYNENPKYYLDTVEPGRAFDAAQAGDGVSPLKRVGNSFHETIQNKAVTLQVQASAGMPVSFTTFDGGVFDNGLGFITVQADSSGYASVDFTATTGVINQTRIKASSPVHSQTLNWKVLVHLPDNDK